MFTETPDPDTVQFKNSLNLPNDNNKPIADLFATIGATVLGNTVYLKARGVQDIQIATNSGSKGVGGGSWTDVDTSGGFVPYVDIANCVAGDSILVFATGYATSVIGAVSLRLSGIEDYGGTNVEAPVPGAATTATNSLNPALGSFSQGMTMIGRLYVTHAGAARVELQALGSATLTGFTLLAVRVRPI